MTFWIKFKCLTGAPTTRIRHSTLGLSPSLYFFPEQLECPVLAFFPGRRDYTARPVHVHIRCKYSEVSLISKEKGGKTHNPARVHESNLKVLETKRPCKCSENALHMQYMRLIRPLGRPASAWASKLT